MGAMLGFRPAALALGFSVLTACGSTPPSTAPSTPLPSASAKAPMEPAKAPEPATPVGTRASSNAFVLRLRPSALVKGRDLFSSVLTIGQLDEVGTDIGLDHGELRGPDPLAKLGIDPAGVVTIESFQLDERGAAIVDRMRGLRADVDEATLGASAVETYRSTGRRGWFLSRVNVPIRGDALGELVERGLTLRGARRVPLGAGDVAYVLGRSVWHVRSTKSELSVELALGDTPTEPRDVRAGLAALAAWAPTSEPALAPREDVVLRTRPGALATAGYFLGIARLGELDDTRLDPDAAQRFAARVGREVRALDGIDAPDGAPRYESVVVSFAGDTISHTSTLSPGAEAFRARDFDESGAEVSIDHAFLQLSIDGALLYGWRLIPSTDGANPYYARDVKRAVERAGFPAELLLVGEAPFLLVRVAMEEAESIGQATLPFMRKWDRLGVVLVERPSRSPESVFVGVLPASTTEEAAACALSRGEKGCPTSERLRANATTNRNGYAITRKKEGGRWVVLACRDEKILKEASVHVTVGARPAFAGMIDPQVFARSLGVAGKIPLPVLHGKTKLASDGRSFTVTIEP